MNQVELLSVSLLGIAKLSIWGPEPKLNQGSPALARSSLLHVLKSVPFNLSILGESEMARSQETTPFLFEQTQYHFDLAFYNNSGPVPELLLHGNDLLKGRKSIGNQRAFSVTVNFQSEVGYTNLELRVGKQRLFVLQLEVFPTKLDYRTDLLELRADLQMEVRALIFELYGRTFQKQHRKPGQRPHDIEWVSLLREEFARLSKALEIICRTPLTRLAPIDEISRKFKAAKTNITTRCYVRRHSAKCVKSEKGHFRANGKSWISPQLPRGDKTLTIDTVENRFVASTVDRMRMRLRRLRSQLAEVKGEARFADWKDFLVKSERILQRFQTQTILATLPRYDTNARPTLALHLTLGYREFFSSSLALECVLEVGGGPLELSEKDLSTLYECWCFVALSSLLRRELNLQPRPPSWLRVTQRRASLELVKGKTSVLTMERNGRERVRVIYNRENSTPTGNCKPDNTLEIITEDTASTFRYIFDAKYRLKSDPTYIAVNRAPGPPEDAIYRMHAYRDQIVHENLDNIYGGGFQRTVWDVGYRRWIQQTVGAFVLYPYSGGDAAENRFFRSIDKVGIGGVPFLPSRKMEVTNLVKRIIETSAESVEDTAVELSSIDQRRRIELAHQFGLIAIVPTHEQLNYLLEHSIYHTPYEQHRRWGLRLKCDFILFLLSRTKFPERAGVAYKAEINSVHFGERKSIEPNPPQSQRDVVDSDLYIWFRVSKPELIIPQLKYDGYAPRFAFTTRLAFEEAMNVDELLLIREPERRFYTECRLAGLDVRLYEEATGQLQVFDLGQLRLRFEVTRGNEATTTIRFNPETGTFTSNTFHFTWNEFMFEPQRYLQQI